MYAPIGLIIYRSFLWLLPLYGQLWPCINTFAAPYLVHGIDQVAVVSRLTCSLLYIDDLFLIVSGQTSNNTNRQHTVGFVDHIFLQSNADIAELHEANKLTLTLTSLTH